VTDKTSAAKRLRPGRGKYADKSECPDRAKHTVCPVEYLSYSEWAVAMGKTHDQFQCPTCGYWSIWKPKKKAAK
jgi:predicted RNA-binding Zn-ribbon protein involved in translation (DUF1610 family)